MKSYSLSELKNHVREFEPLLGAQLQEIETHPKGLALGLYKQGRIWWILDLTPQAPMSVVLYEDMPWKKKITPKPVALFLNSHGKNLFLSKIEVIEGAGRVLCAEFIASGRYVRLEVHLIPKAVNVIVQTGDKSISWSKPKDLGMPPNVEGPFRDIVDIKSEWLAEQGVSAAGGVKAPSLEEKRNRDLAKKKKAVGELIKQLASDEASKWQTLGELLKSFEPSELGDEWREYLKFSKNRTELMQHCFEKAKQMERKKSGTAERVQILQKEIATLESGVVEPKSDKPVRSQLKDAGVEGRTKRVGEFVFSRGKNAHDNLALLRAAKGWDLWIHLRDYPSSHVILALQKNQKVPDAVIREAAVWLAQETIKSKTMLSGSRLDVVVAECRFVKPIKGDKLGRVHYQNERVLTVTLP